MKNKESLDLNQFIDSSKKIDMSKYSHIKPIKNDDPILEYLQRMYPGVHIVKVSRHEFEEPSNLMYEDDIIEKIRYFLTRGFNNGFFSL